MISLTEKELESSTSQKNCRICQEKFKGQDADDEKYRKVRDDCHYTGKCRGAVRCICNLR